MAAIETPKEMEKARTGESTRIPVWRRSGTHVLTVGVMLVALAMLLGVAVGSPSLAHAVTTQTMQVTQTQTEGNKLGFSYPQHRINYTYNGTNYHLGIIAFGRDDTPFYCIEAGKMTDYMEGPTHRVDDDPVARRLAWLMQWYRHATREQYAAIAILVQDKLGNQEQWQPQRAYLEPLHPDVFALAEEMWAESEDKTPANATVESTYAEGPRRGEVKVSVVNGAGQLIAKVPFTITLNGPAVFEKNGEAVLTGDSGEQPLSFAWKATGKGEVSASVSYEIPRMQHMDALQDMRGFDSMVSEPGGAVTFKVQDYFTPSVSTKVSGKVLDAGAAVFDEVTSGVAEADRQWVDDLLLRAQGYYFDGLTIRDLDNMMAPKTAESADDYLARIRQAGYAPVAYGDVSFTGAGQSERVQAMTKPDGDKPYLTGKSGGFGTWVWVFRKSEQNDKAQNHLKGDWSSAFLEAEESSSNRSRVEVESTVTEHTAHVGSQLSDTITVKGFPDDHGEFSGNETFGFGADRPYAQVSVWWAGDENDPSKNEEYKPTGAETPNQDEHHRELITWNIPAKNGTFKIGAGALDANGTPMNITAERHGWYVFVWEFAGDDRVTPAASRYDDAWERTWVPAPCEPEEPCEPDEPCEPEEPCEPGKPEEPCEPEEPGQPEEPTPPEEPLPGTGIDLVPPMGIAAAFLSIGLAVLFVANRHRAR